MHISVTTYFQRNLVTKFTKHLSTTFESFETHN